jgi:SAM-dependent methyltransferase
MHPRSRFSELDFTFEQAQEIANIAETQGWQIAAHDSMRAFNHAAYRLAIDESRGQLRFLLPLAANDRVLQLRCGWGSIAINLAGCSVSVVAIDDRLSRLRFVSARRKQMNIQGLHTLGANINRILPFTSRVFDAVIILDAYEEEGAYGNGKDCVSRENLLKETMRVLKPGGWLLLAGINRLGFARPKVYGREPILTYWGYRRLMQTAGFDNPQFHAPLPSHLEPFYIIPLDNSYAFDHFTNCLFSSSQDESKLKDRGLGLRFRLASAMYHAARSLRLISLARFFVPSYLLVVQKKD